MTPPPKTGAARYETRGLTFGSYTFGDASRDGRSSRRMLTHSVRIVEGEPWAPLCRVNADAIDCCVPVDGIDDQPTCATCLRRDPRFKVKAHAV